MKQNLIKKRKINWISLTIKNDKLRKDCTALFDDCAELSGDCSELFGDDSDCEITKKSLH